MDLDNKLIFSGSFPTQTLTYLQELRKLISSYCKVTVLFDKEYYDSILLPQKMEILINLMMFSGLSGITNKITDIDALVDHTRVLFDFRTKKLI